MPQQNSETKGSPFQIVTNKPSRKFNGKVLGVVLLVLFLLAIAGIAVYLVGTKTNLNQKAAPETSIFISPGAATKSQGDNFTFSVSMDTSTNAVTGIDVRLAFDPSVMQVTSLEQGSGVTNLNQTITNTYDNTAGTINYAIFTLNSSQAVVGSGLEVLKVNATINSNATPGNYNITFDPATAASASQEGQNVLVSKTQGVLTVQQSVATQAPTPTSTATTGPTPTATATSGATSVPTPTATATVNATVSPTATSSSTNAPTSTASATTTARPVASQTPIPIPVTGRSLL